jgi:SAM-dependent methyltransferase
MALKAKTVELLPERLDADVALKLGLAGLNSGCGTRMHSGCLNSDKAEFIAGDGTATEPGRLALVDGHHYLQHDATLRHPLHDDSFEWILSEHFIEHVPPAQAIAWLGELRRLLRPGGVLRVSTPDLQRYVEGYLDPNGAFFDEHRTRLEPIVERYFRSGGERAHPAGIRHDYFEDETTVPARRAFMFNQIFLLPLWNHRWIYDFDELRHAATLAGFPPAAVVKRAFRESSVTGLGELDAAMRSDESLYVEMTKT